MRNLLTAALLGFALLLPLAGCKDEETTAAPPPPQAITADATGHYCGMNMLDHPGPKGQIILEGKSTPIWLSSVRDTFAYTMLPEESHEYRAIYVTDLTKAADPSRPDLDLWTEARNAWFVVGSGFRGGMGAAEPLPFAEETAARNFAAAHGGSVKRFSEVSDDTILASPEETDDPGEGGKHDGRHGPHSRSMP
ncbi:nitrous oxide reductase accessory protein NosL [Skermanella rosea]|uniref:nitrous oxide reductase accessory protein NosL n=1 Tax=Skermanella rosea TaxID=1817965 RepID=UPI001931F07D|nr:nitrous oxide reductase accessory protein NosL [Skermanella rosea]UEM06350.1 nitrous oxide reductase accessory protein NosL [Skermanella rosea]